MARSSTPSRSARSRRSSRCACVSTKRDIVLASRVHDRCTRLCVGDIGSSAEIGRVRPGRGTIPAVRNGSALIADQLQSISRHLETLATQVLMQAWVELGDQIGVISGRQVMNGSGSQATKMVMQVAAGVVPASVAADSRSQLGRHSDGDQGFERLVYCRQTDPGNLRPDGLKDVFGGGMFGRLAEMIVDGEPLRSAPQTGFLDDRSKILMIERQGFHRLSTSLAALTSNERYRGRAGVVADDGRARPQFLQGTRLSILGPLDSRVNHVLD